MISFQSPNRRCHVGQILVIALVILGTTVASRGLFRVLRLEEDETDIFICISSYLTCLNRLLVPVRARRRTFLLSCSPSPTREDPLNDLRKLNGDIQKETDRKQRELRLTSFGLHCGLTCTRYARIGLQGGIRNPEWHR